MEENKQTKKPKTKQNKHTNPHYIQAKETIDFWTTNCSKNSALIMWKSALEALATDNNTPTAILPTLQHIKTGKLAWPHSRD